VHNALPLAWMVVAMVLTFFAALVVDDHSVADTGRGRHLCQQRTFWALSSEWLGVWCGGAGLAQINALGNLASFFFNYMIGWIKDETGSYAAALMPIAIVATTRHDLRGGGWTRSPRTVVVPELGSKAGAAD